MDRSQVEDRTIKALYTKLLFILTRCSRLLITQQTHMFATEPRSQRMVAAGGYEGKSPGSGSVSQRCECDAECQGGRALIIILGEWVLGPE